jgi:hypothetical protein
MPRPAQWFEKFDPITADFTYVRWLGDRKGYALKDNKVAVFNKDGDATFSKSTRALGSAVKDACEVIRTHPPKK